MAEARAADHRSRCVGGLGRHARRRPSTSSQRFCERRGADSRLRGILAELVAPLSGAIAALLVLAAFWAAGLIGPAAAAQPAVSVAQFDNVAANVGDLTARLARVEAAAAKAPAPATDPALAARTEALEKSLAAVREEVAS